MFLDNNYQYKDALTNNANSIIDSGTDIELIDEEKKSSKDMYYGLPKLKKFPLYDEKHVRLAVKFFNYAKGKDEQVELCNAIIKRAKELNVTNIKIPSNSNLRKYIDPSESKFQPMFLSSEEYNLKNDIINESIDIKFKTPEELSKWMKINIHYANFTKLMTSEELLKNKRGSCHDQAYFIYHELKKMDKPCGMIFFIEYNKEKAGSGGMTHTLTWYKDKGKLYWLENAWGGMQKIHGPFNSTKDIKNKIIELHEHFPSYRDFPDLEFKSVQSMKYGCTLSELVNNILNENNYFQENIKTKNLICGENILGSSEKENNKIKYDIIKGNVYIQTLKKLPNNLYITSDIHLGKDDSLPVEKCIDIVNRDIPENGTLLILGDIGYKRDNNCSKSLVKYFLKNIKCKAWLVIGNHDWLTRDEYLDMGFQNVCHKLIYNNITFTHYPINNKNGICFHGHIHFLKLEDPEIEQFKLFDFNNIKFINVFFSKHNKIHSFDEYMKNNLINEAEVLYSKKISTLSSPNGKRYDSYEDPVATMGKDAIDDIISKNISHFKTEKMELLLDSKNLVDDFNKFVGGEIYELIMKFKNHEYTENPDNEFLNEFSSIVRIMAEDWDKTKDIIQKNIPNSKVNNDSDLKQFLVNNYILPPYEQNEETIKLLIKERSNYNRGMKALFSEMLKRNYKILGFTSKEAINLVQDITSDDKMKQQLAHDKIGEQIQKNYKSYMNKQAGTLDLRKVGGALILGTKNFSGMEDYINNFKDQLLQKGLYYDAIVLAHGEIRSTDIDKEKSLTKGKIKLEDLQYELNELYKQLDFCKAFGNKPSREELILFVALYGIVNYNILGTPYSYEDIKKLLNKKDAQFISIIYDLTGIDINIIKKISNNALKGYKLKIQFLMKNTEEFLIDYNEGKVKIKSITQIQQAIANCKNDIKIKENEYKNKSKQSLVGTKVWDIQPISYRGKTYKDMNPLIRALIKNGFKNIYIASCNPGHFRLAPDIEKYKDIKISYGLDTMLKETTDFNILMGEDEVINNLIETENNLKSLSEEYNIDYKDDKLLFEGYYQVENYISSHDILNESLSEILSNLGKSLIKFVIFIWKKVVEFFKFIYTKIKELLSLLFQKLGLISNNDKKEKFKNDEIIETGFISVKKNSIANIKRIKSDNLSDIENDIKKSCNDLSLSIKYLSENQTKYTKFLSDKIEKNPLSESSYGFMNADPKLRKKQIKAARKEIKDLLKKYDYKCLKPFLHPVNFDLTEDQYIDGSKKKFGFYKFDETRAMRSVRNFMNKDAYNSNIVPKLDQLINDLRTNLRCKVELEKELLYSFIYIYAPEGNYINKYREDKELNENIAGLAPITNGLNMISIPDFDDENISLSDLTTLYEEANLLINSQIDYNLFKEDFNINEFSKNKNDLNFNMDLWGKSYHNILFITGFSDIGKITLADKISKKFNVPIIKIYEIKPEFNEKYPLDDKKRFYTNYYKSLLTYIKNKYHNKKIIIEGPELVWLDSSYLVNEPLIIQENNLIKGLINSIHYDKNEGIKFKIKNINKLDDLIKIFKYNILKKNIFYSYDNMLKFVKKVYVPVYEYEVSDNIITREKNKFLSFVTYSGMMRYLYDHDSPSEEDLMYYISIDTEKLFKNITSNDVIFDEYYHMITLNKDFKFNLNGIQIHKINDNIKNINTDELLSEVSFNIDVEGSMIIKLREKTDFMAKYNLSHKLLKIYERTNNIEGIKHELCKLWFMYIVIEKFYINNKSNSHNKKYIELKKEAQKAKGFILNDFYYYLEFILKKNNNFDFSKYYEDSPYYKDSIKISTDTVKGIKKLIQTVIH